MAKLTPDTPGKAGQAEDFSLNNAIKKKKMPALLCGGLAALWVILLNAFPLPFYSLFLASNIGSNVFLLLLAAVITFPVNLLFSKILKADISGGWHFAVNGIFMTGVVYTYSIFRYTAVWWVIIAVVLHCAACAFLFTKAKREGFPGNSPENFPGNSPKNSTENFPKNSRKNSPKKSPEKGKKNPTESLLRLALFGIICAAVSDFFYLLLFTLALYALRG